MKIIIAGAGAGKTTSMAEEVLNRFSEIEKGKIIYVITYTNSARDHIRKKIIEQYGNLPNQIKVETSHVFLLQEIIFPFYHLLYGQLYTKVSVINLPDNHMFKARRLKELREQNIIHVEEVTKIARNVIHGKSDDKKLVKEKRKMIISIIKRYLDSIYIDEAQDMDLELSKIVDVLYNNEFNLHIVGDPKQDLRGRNELRKLVSKYPEFVEYKKENHRCPISHINLSNQYVIQSEQQNSQTSKNGEIGYLFESEIDILDFFEKEVFDYKYIYQKTELFFTNDKDRKAQNKLLEYELTKLLQRTRFAQEHPEKISYLLCKWIKNKLNEKNNWDIINKIGETLSVELTKEDKARLYTALTINREGEGEKEGVIVVNSIDRIKGLEGNRCLFILTTELAEYFFKNKSEQNKMLNYLYVALTRAKQELIILITKEVELKYERTWLEEKLKDLL